MMGHFPNTEAVLNQRYTLLCHENRRYAKIIVLCICKKPPLNYCRVAAALPEVKSEILKIRP